MGIAEVEHDHVQCLGRDAFGLHVLCIYEELNNKRMDLLDRFVTYGRCNFRNDEGSAPVSRGFCKCVREYRLTCSTTSIKQLQSEGSQL